MPGKEKIFELLNKLKKYSLLILIGFVLVAGGSAYYFYKQYSALKRDPQSLAKKETAVLVEKIGRLIVLPEGEEPTVATVSDPEKLKNQPFFVKAKAGYKVLIYTNAKKAILYDPFLNKIVEVAPLNIGNNL